MTATPAALAAALADHYTIGRELGQGGMATVYLAHDLKHDRDVALKVLRPELAAVLGRDRFLTEIRLTAKLDHPHILTLIDSGESDSFLWYVLPYVRGESLRDRLTRDKPLGVEEALAITKQIAGALEYAHQHGVIHRDVKPENILLHEGEAMLADFGIALAVKQAAGNRLTETGLSLGTPQYMSPEQATGERQLDARSDVYSLAAVLYEMLAGEPPVTGPTVQAVIAKLMTERPTRLRVIRDTVPEGIDAAVAKALAKVPADRFGSARELVEALIASGKAAGRDTRWWKRLLPVVALLVLAGIAALRLQHRGASVDAKRVSVRAFINKTGDATLDPVGAMAADLITHGLSETGVVEIVGAGAGTVVAGSFYRQGDSLAFTADVTDASAGKVLAKIGPETAPRAAPLRGIEKLQARAMGGIAMMFDQSYGLQGIILRVAPRYDAYREFATGEEAFYRNEPDSAVAHYRRAALLDSTFVYPLLRMTDAYYQRYVQWDSILAIVSSRRETLSPFESAYLQSAATLRQGDFASSYTASQEMARIAPKSDFAKYGLANSADYAGHWREAVAILEHLNPESGMLRGRIFYYDYLTTSLHLMGEHQRELAAAERGRQQYADRLYIRLLEVRALAALGRTGDVDARVSETLSMPSSPDGSPADVISMAAAELRAHGNAAAGRAMNDRLLAWLARRPPADAATELMRLWRGRGLYFAGRWEEARPVFDSLAAEHPDSVVYVGWRGRIAARRGDRAEAGRLAGQLASQRRPNLFGRQTYARAAISAILGDKAQAVQLLQDAIAQGVQIGTWESDMDFEGVRDYPPFRELIKPRG